MTPSGRRPLPFAYRLAVSIIRPLLMILTKRDWRGWEHLPETGGFVVAPNHISHVDPLAFAHYLYDSGRSPFFLGKESVFRVPVVGAILRGAQQIPVHRNTGQAVDAFGPVGTDCCGMFVSLLCSTLGGLRNCSTDGAAGGMAGATDGACGIVGMNPEELPGGHGSGG